MSTSSEQRVTTLSQPAETLGQADVGVVLIHGIGNIEAGEMARNFAQGLATTSEREVDEHLRSADDAEQHHLNAGHRSVRFYDAHWSELIQKARLPFDFNWVRRVAWFPWFNMRHGLYDTRIADAVRTILWWPILMVAIVGLQLGYRGWVTVVGVWYAMKAPFKPEDSFPDQVRHVGHNILKIGEDFRHSLPQTIEETAKAGRDQAELTVRSAQAAVDKRLRIASDVFVYINSAALEKNADEESCAEQIDALFMDTLAKAAEDCNELQIVAHSLGTVITDRCVTHAAADPETYAWIHKLTHIYTMGCPLEKIRFFWPMVLAPNPRAPDENTLEIRWTNFSDPLDLIAGKLIHFDRWGAVENLPLFGLGGPATAHSKKLYQQHVHFQRSVASRLLRRFYPLRRRAVFRTLQAGKTIAETLGVLFLLAVVLIIGGASFAAAPLISLGWVMDEFDWSPWLLLGIITGVPLMMALASYDQAKFEYEQFVNGGSTPEEPP